MRGHLWHKRDLGAKNVDIRMLESPDAPRRTRWAPLPRGGPSIRLDIALAINELFDQLMDEDPVYLQTHPYTLGALVQRSNELGVRPPALRGVRTFGEVLDPPIRDACQKAWAVPVADAYSANELGTIAHQCPETTNLHVMAESVLVEILDDDGRACEPGETGRVVVTALHNFATPLIRYELGDYATQGGTCPCGRTLPALARVLGRVRNLICYPDGARRFLEAWVGEIASIAPIRQFQLTQRTLQQFEVKLAVGRALSAAEEDAVQGMLTDKLQHPFEFQLVYVDEIPRAANGKYEEIRSEVSAAPA